MPVCAYCKQERPATREHVIPSFLYSFQKTLSDGIVGWNEVVEKMVRGEAKVKDVCAECNHTVLSELDSYGKTLLSCSGLLVHNYVKRSLQLPYDFDLLLRWLIKISYNSARTDGAHAHLFENFTPFVLGRESAPPRSQIGLLAYLASPVVLSGTEANREPFRKVAQGASTFNPLLVRICYGLVPGDPNVTLRLIIFGPLMFLMPVFRPGTLPGHAAASIRRIQKLAPGAMELRGSKKFVELATGPHSWLDLYALQVQRARQVASEA